MAYIPNSSSVVSFQGNPSVLQATVGLNSTNASVITVGSPVANQSVSGTVGASIIGHAPVVIVGGSVAASFTPPANQSVSGTVNVGNFPTTQNVSGSVVATQGTNPWIITGSVQGTFSAGNSSVQVLNFPTNQSVSGTVGTTQSGTWISSIVNTIPSSVIVGASAFGTFPVTQATTPWNIAGSVAAFQAGTRITSVSGQITVVSSIAGGIFPISGSVAGVITAWQNPSIVGTYQEDAAHTTADRGLFTLAVRNDTVASFVGANNEYAPTAVDSAGRVLTKPYAAEEARVEGYNSVVSTSVTTLVPAAGTGLRNYITDVWITNTGAAATLVTFRSGGGASVLGYTIAPAGGGSNLPGLNTPMRTLANQTFDIQATTATSVLYATVTGYKAP